MLIHRLSRCEYAAKTRNQILTPMGNDIVAEMMAKANAELGVEGAPKSKGE